MEKPKNIILRAQSCLDGAADTPRKFTAIHAGIALGFSLLVAVLNFILGEGIGSTSGLSGMGLRSVLSTVQVLLQFASFVLMPFWQISYAGAALSMSRKKRLSPDMYLEGFRRFFAVLVLLFAQSVLIFLLGLACFYVCSGIFIATPLGRPFMEAIAPMLSQENIMSGNLYVDEATLTAAMDALIPMLLLFSVVFLVVSIPLMYRFRMCEMLLMDYPQLTGMRVFKGGIRIMRGQCRALFRLDLQFWWFYVLQTLVTVIGYGDLLLPLFGVELFSNPDLAYFLFYILHTLALFALLVWKKPLVQTSYALFYEELKQFHGLPDRDSMK